MRTAPRKLVVLAALLTSFAAGREAAAEILSFEAAGSFLELIGEDAVIRGESAGEPQLLKVANGQFGLDHGSASYIGLADTVVVDFFAAATHIVITGAVKDPNPPAKSIEILCIEANGAMRQTGVHYVGYGPWSVNLDSTTSDSPVRSLRIRAPTGSLQIASIAYDSKALRPGVRVEALIEPGGHRDAFLLGCEGRSLRFDRLASGSGSKLIVEIAPADEAVEAAKPTSFVLAAGKSKVVPLCRPELHRVRFRNAGKANSAFFEIDTADVLGKSYFLATRRMTTADWLACGEPTLSALPATTSTLAILPDAAFTATDEIGLVELPLALRQIDLGEPTMVAGSAAVHEKFAIVRGGPLGIVLDGDIPKQGVLEIRFERTAPTAGKGKLVL
jgi:hypothetical protein